MRDDILIWWTSESDCRVIGEPHDQSDPDDRVEADGIHDTSTSPLPPYILREFQSRWGRAGRGRLWVSQEIPWVHGQDGVIPWPNEYLAHEIDRYAMAGIVFLRDDLALIAAMPGFVTDMELGLVLPSRGAGAAP